MFSEEFKRVLSDAATISFQIGRSEIDEFSVALALSNLPSIRQFSGELGIDTAALQDDLVSRLKKFKRNSDSGHMGLTNPVRDIIRLAEGLAARSGSEQFSAIDFLYCLSSGAGELTPCQEVLKWHGLDADAIARKIAIQRHADWVMLGISHGNGVAAAPTTAASTTQPQGLLGVYCDDLTSKARNGKIEPVHFRDSEIDKTIRILCRRKKRNPILLGEPGVGKTAIAEGLAVRIVQGNVPKKLIGVRLLALNIGDLIGGTRYRGDLEERIDGLLKELQAAGDVVLFIDEIHTIIGHGSLGEVSNILKPALAAGLVSCIGATTHHEYRLYFEKDAAMCRRFRKVDVVEPTREEAVNIIKAIIPKYAEFHGVAYDDGVAEEAVDQAIAFIVNQQLPDKAIDIIDELGADARMSGIQLVRRDQVSGVVASIRGELGAKMPSPSALGTELDRVLPGQEQACSSIIAAITRGELGLSNSSGVHSFMVLGGGNDRQEAADAMGKALGWPVHDLDCAEYPDHASVSRLLGANPGYIGFEQGGVLTEQLRRKPFSILNVTNIHQAHADVVSIIARMLDRGLVKDASGREISTKGVILAMTLGTEGGPKRIGFNLQNESADHPRIPNQIGKFVDKRIIFAETTEASSQAAIGELIAAFTRRLDKSKIVFALSEDVREGINASVSKCRGRKEIEDLFNKKVRDPVFDLMLE